MDGPIHEIVLVVFGPSINDLYKKKGKEDKNVLMTSLLFCRQREVIGRENLTDVIHGCVMDLWIT